MKKMKDKWNNSTLHKKRLDLRRVFFLDGGVHLCQIRIRLDKTY